MRRPAVGEHARLEQSRESEALTPAQQARGLRHIETRLSVNLDRVAKTANVGIVIALAGSAVLGHLVSFYFHFLTVFFLILNLLNFYWRHVQRHTLLANFGFVAQVRYVVESIGPEFRQYLYASDTEERPFSRNRPVIPALRLA